MSSEEWIENTQKVLSKVITKTPLTPKLLGKPPFRYLHDLITEISDVTKLSIPTLSSQDLDPGNFQDKDSKISFLSKVISFVESKTGAEVEAKPSKIVAGKDPELTNKFLEIFTELAIKIQSSQLINTTDQAAPAAAKETEKSHSLSKSASGIVEKNNAVSSQEQKKSPASKPLNTRTTVNSKSKEVAQPAAPTPQPTLSTKKKGSMSTEKLQDPVKKGEIEQQITSPPALRPTDKKDEEVKKMARPTTARAGPPKPKKIEVEPPKPVIISKPVEVIKETTIDPVIQIEEDESFLIIENPNADLPDDFKAEGDGDHGGLVKKLLESKREYAIQSENTESLPIEADPDLNSQRLKERQETEKQVNLLRDGIQTLCRNTHPLAKTMDYIQEDLDAMGREFSVWRQEVNANVIVYEKERRETSRLLEPLQGQLGKLQHSVKNLNDQLREKKSIILQNEAMIQKLVLNMVTTTSK